MKTIDEAIQYAAKNLPERASVIIKIEKDGYAVEIEAFDHDGSSQIIGVSEDSLVDDIITATDAAPDFVSI